MTELAAVEVDEPVFDEDEFVEYWETHTNDGKMAEEWIGFKIKQGFTESLENVALKLAQRNGVSSDAVKNFRSAMRNASKKEGLEEPLSFRFKKTRGMPTSAHVGTARKKSTVHTKSNAQKAHDRMKKWCVKESFTVLDLQTAVDQLKSEGYL